MGRIRAFVIPTGGPQSGLKWRNLFKQISRLRFAPEGQAPLEMTTLGTLKNVRLPQSLRSFAMTEGALRSEFYAIELLF